MNEITRIHIAKVAYDVEVGAKKELEKYFKQLKVALDDEDIVNDIELRVVELLAERGVTAGGVITLADVEAVRDTLGAPSDFSDEDVELPVGEKRLFRDTDGALLGGVLSGIAKYFGVSSLFVRLGFIVLMLVSFGFAAALYAVLWVLLPPTKSAADKLLLEGKVANARAILEASQDKVAAKTPIFALALRIVFAIMAIGAALGVVLLVTGLSLQALLFPSRNIMHGIDEVYRGDWITGGVVISGLVFLVVFLSTIAYALIRGVLNTKITAIVATSFILGLTSVGVYGGLIYADSQRANQAIEASTSTVNRPLSGEFKSINTLDITTNSEGGFDNYVNYVVSDDPHYELKGLNSAKADITVDGTTAKLKLNAGKLPSLRRGYYPGTTLTIYGPRLSSLSINGQQSNLSVSYDGKVSKSLNINVVNGNSVSIMGSYEELNVSGGDATVDLGSARVRNLVVDSKQNLKVDAGVVENLKVTQPNVCGSSEGSRETYVQVVSVASGNVEYNGQATLTQSEYKTGCAKLTIGDENYVSNNE